MWITNLELRNIKSHVDSGTIPFVHGVNAISGPNGAGKSTILEAIGFALFDSLPYTQSQFLREGEKNGEVVVSFIDVIDEREYQVVRTVGSSSIYVFDPQVKSKIVSGKVDVVDWLKEHLGVAASADLKALFEDSIGVPQGLLTAAFLENPAGRKAKFNPLLQVDEYEEAWTRLREVARVLNNEIQSLSQQIAEMRGELKQLPALEQEHSQMDEKYQKRHMDRQALQDQLEQHKQEQAVLDKEKEQLQESESKVKSLDTRVQLLESQYKDVRSAVLESETAAEQIEVVRNAYLSYMQADEELKALESQRSEREELRLAMSDLDKEIALSQQQLERLMKSLAEMQDAEKQLTRIEPLVKQQEELERSLSNTNKRIAELEVKKSLLSGEEEKLSSLQDQLAETRQSVAHRKTLIEQQEEASDALRSLEMNIAKLEAELASTQAELVKIEQHRAALDESEGAACPICHQPLDDTHRERLVNDYIDQVQQLDVHARDIHEKRALALEEHVNKQAGLDQVIVELDQLPDDRHLSALETEQKNLEASIEAQRKDLKELSLAQTNLDDLQRTLDALEDPRTTWSLLKAQIQSRDEVGKEKNTLTNQLADQRSERINLEKSLEAFQSLDEQLSSCRIQRENDEPGYRTYLANISIAERLEGRRASFKKITDELESVHKQLEVEEQSFEDSRQSYNETRHNEVRAEVISKTGDLARMETLIEEADKRLEQLQREIRTLYETQERLDASENTLKRSEASAEALEFIRALIRQAGPFVTRALVQTISIEANRIFGEIMNDHTLRLVWNEDYSITLEQSGEQRDFPQLSGGEKMAAALSIRLALLRELSQIRVAFFDEPTSNLDDQRRENLASQITQITGFNQLFVISHDDTFERETHHVIRVDKSQGSSHVEVG